MFYLSIQAGSQTSSFFLVGFAKLQANTKQEYA